MSNTRQATIDRSVQSVREARMRVRFNNYTPHVSRDVELKNRDILRSIGASESQIFALSHRTFPTLPLWARKRLKRIMKGTNYLAPKKSMPAKWHFRHLNKAELAAADRSAPRFQPRWEWVRDENAHLRRIDVVA